MIKRRTEVVFEMDRVILVDRVRIGPRWCPSCSRQVEMMNVDEAALATHLTSRAIFHQVETGLLHSVETGEGLLVICTVSLGLVN